MAISNAKMHEFMLKLLNAKSSIVIKYPFFGFLLNYLGFALDEECETACTNGEKIIFGTGFLEKLSNDEVIFIMLHEVMHCVLNHPDRRGNRDHKVFNIAADIVVNSMVLESIGVSGFEVNGTEPMHLTPDGKEGKDFSTEEVYQMLVSKAKISNKRVSPPDSEGGNSKESNNSGSVDYDFETDDYRVIDDHSRWKHSEINETDAEDWTWRIVAAVKHAKDCTPFGHLPEFVRDFINDLESHEVDWRTALQNFCQRIESFDFSWIRGDKRYIERDIFLPDYTDDDSSEMEVKNLLFFVDTSGSMSTEDVNIMLAEIRSAISVFNGRLRGKLGFFDTEITDPVDFTDEASFNLIKPESYGGTSFNCIFNYVNDKLTDNPPAAIIIMTDGYALFPEESITKGIPVLWIINNSEVKPPWGEFICVDTQ